MRIKYFLLIFVAAAFASCTTSFYIVRHADKAQQGPGMSSDVPLSAAGLQRAVTLKDTLKNKKIGYVFSTNTIRTMSTAQPTATEFGLTIQNYGPTPDAAFINQIKALNKNTLIVGHSNTIDDIVNQLCGSVQVPADISESVFDNLFVVKKKNGVFTFTAKKYGVVTN